MTFQRVGTNLTRDHRRDFSGLSGELDYLKHLGADFVEVWPELLGLIAGGRLDRKRASRIEAVLLDADLAYTVHAPLDINLMDTGHRDLHLGVLEAGLRFAAGIGAGTLVCHAGQRHASRDALVSFKEQLAAERAALRKAGDLASELGIAIAVENYYPDLAVVRGEIYDYSVRPSELAEMVSGVDHPSVGLCLDTGHAALSASAFGLDLIRECAAAAPLVRHIHLHDNFRKVNMGGEPGASEHRVLGLGDLHLPPGGGTIPLVELFEKVDFPLAPSCCVELSGEFPHLAGEALAGARHVVREAGREPLAS